MGTNRGATGNLPRRMGDRERASGPPYDLPAPERVSRARGVAEVAEIYAHTGHVEAFIECLNAHDYDGLAQHLSERFVRVSGHDDISTFTPEGYVQWVKHVLRGVEVYGKVVRQVVYSEDRRTVYVDLIEFGGPNAGAHENASVYVFKLAEDGLIDRMALYTMPSEVDEPVP
jgi:hypothetical protein